MYRVYMNDQFFFGTGSYARPGYEVISPVIALSKNRSGSFTFTIYPGHPLFGEIQEITTFVEIKRRDKVFFRGRVLSIQSGFFNQKSVTCEGCLGYLTDSIQRPYDFMSGDKNTDPEKLFKYFIGQHNLQVEKIKRFFVGKVTVTDPNDYIVRMSSGYTSTWDAIEEKLTGSSLGGFLNVRYEKNGNYVDYLEEAPEGELTVEFGKNLLDLVRTENADELATVMIPIGTGDGFENVTIAALDDNTDGDICKTGDYIYSQKGVEKYGWIVKAVTFEDIVNPVFLLSAAKKQLAKIIGTARSVEITAADLSAVNAEIESFSIGQKVRVVSSPHNIEESFEVASLEINLSSPGENRLVLGEETDSISDRI
jgi:hypothetical protein